MYTSCGETVTVMYPSSKYVYVYVCIYVCICEVCIYICDGNNKKNIKKVLLQCTLFIYIVHASQIGYSLILQQTFIVPLSVDTSPISIS